MIHKPVIAVLLLSLSLAACTHQASEVVKRKKKPNIIFILADDLGYGDVSSYGQGKFQTPNIDKLKQGGMKFNQHYAGSTVCAPSRAVLLSGMHTGHNPIRGNERRLPEGQMPLPDSIITVAESLQQAGYTTGAFGKWGLGFPGSEGQPGKQGFDEFYGYLCQSLAHRYYPTHLWHNTQQVALKNDGTHTVEYAQDSIQSRAMQFMADNKDSSFFLYLPYLLPHAELVVPEDSIFDQFKGEFSEKAYEGRDYGPGFNERSYASQSHPRAAFAAMVTRLDEYVGQILSNVQALGIEEETIIIFTSDNGPHMEGGADPDFFNSNGPLRGYKRDLYEGGIRVPFLVYWKGNVAPGTETDHVSAFWDFLPTVYDIAEVEIPKNTDGISYLPTLTGQPQKQHDFLYWEFHENGGRQAVRMGNWKGVRLNVDKDNQGQIALFDLSVDRGEEKDVAEHHPAVVEKIRSIMEQEHRYSPSFHFKSEDKK